MTMRAILASSSIQARRVPAGLMSTSIIAGLRPNASMGGGAARTTAVNVSAKSAGTKIFVR